MAKFLLNYRITPHSTTGIAPAELMFGRELRTRFDLLQPDLASKVSKNQEQQKSIFDTHTKDRNFKIVGWSKNVTFTVMLLLKSLKNCAIQVVLILVPLHNKEMMLPNRINHVIAE